MKVLFTARIHIRIFTKSIKTEQLLIPNVLIFGLLGYQRGLKCLWGSWARRLQVHPMLTDHLSTSSFMVVPSNAEKNANFSIGAQALPQDEESSIQPHTPAATAAEEEPTPTLDDIEEK